MQTNKTETMRRKKDLETYNKAIYNNEIQIIIMMRRRINDNTGNG